MLGAASVRNEPHIAEGIILTTIASLTVTFTAVSMISLVVTTVFILTLITQPIPNSSFLLLGCRWQQVISTTALFTINISFTL